MKYLKVWVDFRQNLRPFSDAEKGRLFVAMMEYAELGTEPEFGGNERYIWDTAKAEIDRQREAYAKKCEVNRANVASRYQSLPVVASRNQSKQDKDKDKDVKEKDPPSGGSQKKSAFVAPTLAEVSAFCKKRKSKVNPTRFYNHYRAAGWKMGNGVPLEDWQAMVRKWETDEERPRKQEKQTEPKGDDYSEVYHGR